MLERLLKEQDGVLTRAQALATGMTPGAVRARVESGRWRRLRTGIFAAFTGPASRRCELWAAVLAAGPGAVLSHESAAELVGLIPLRHPQAPIHITIPTGRRALRRSRRPGEGRPPGGVRPPRIVVHRSARVAEATHPVLTPPQTRVEETVIDLTQRARRLADAYGWIAKAVNAGLTTTDRLLTTLRLRKTAHRRRLLSEGLGDVAAGCRSVLEIAYLRDVARAHALPAGRRQASVDGVNGHLYVDVRYRRYAVRVELDGLAAHPPDQRFRDMDRDNAAAEAAELTLRYGTADLTERPCAVARQTATVLTNGGWTGTPRRCARLDCVFP